MRNSRPTTKSNGLLQKAQAGDAEALDRLLALARKFLSQVARTQIGPRLQGKADASDLVQETLLEAHRHFGQFRGSTEAEFAAWIRSILAALVSNHVRRYLGTKQRDARLEQALAVELSSSGPLERPLKAKTSSPSEQAVAHESSARLAAALEHLPEHYRRVIVLRHLEGRSFAEVAKKMERSVDSVEKLWVRALARLRQSLVDRA